MLTMNRIDGVPIEMLRMGRLDSTWFTELPDPAQRRQILEIHLRKNGGREQVVLADVDWKHLVKDTEGYVGAELEQIVIKATRAAWCNRKLIAPNAAELFEARRTIHPVSKLDEAGIKRIADFCAGRATPVGRKTVKASGRRGGVVDLGGPSSGQIDLGASSN